MRKPLVDTSCSVPRLRVPIVDADHQAVGRMAAEHFLERGYRHFGFFGSPWAHYSKLREASFRQRLAEAGYTVSACYVEYLLRAAALIEWKHAAGRVRRWLEELPKPVAILAANDIPARELADTCRRIGLRRAGRRGAAGRRQRRLGVRADLAAAVERGHARPADRLRGGQTARRTDGGQAAAAGADLFAADRRGDPPVDRHVGHP